MTAAGVRCTMPVQHPSSHTISQNALAVSRLGCIDFEGWLYGSLYTCYKYRACNATPLVPPPPPPTHTHTHTRLQLLITMKVLTMTKHSHQASPAKVHCAVHCHLLQHPAPHTTQCSATEAPGTVSSG
jgi:hypothetical protein